MKKYTIIALFFLVFVGKLKAQDPVFSQYYANPLYLNPAMAGSNVGPRVSLNYRNQWPSIPGSFVTYTASYDQYFSKIGGGLGLQVMSDVAGESVFRNNNVALMYSNNLNLSREWSLKTGFQVNYVQKSLNWNNFIFGDQIDPRLGVIRATQEILPSNNATNINYFDFSTGMLAYNKSFYGGFAIHHLTQPNESLLVGGNNDALLYNKLTLHAGANIELTPSSWKYEGMYLSPNVIYQRQQAFGNLFETLNLGLYIVKGPLIGGLWYRLSGKTSDAVSALVGIQKGVFRFGYSYDVTVSGLRNASTGSHEISVTLSFDEQIRRARNRVEKIKCPGI